MRKITVKQLENASKQAEFFRAMANLDIDKAVEISDTMSDSLLRKSLNVCRNYRKELADQ